MNFKDGSSLKENYKDGRHHGSYIKYHDNGKIAEKGQFTDGKRIGIWQTFDEDGKLIAEERF